jgi:hypothetical protein
LGNDGSANLVDVNIVIDLDVIIDVQEDDKEAKSYEEDEDEHLPMTFHSCVSSPFHDPDIAATILCFPLEPPVHHPQNIIYAGKGPVVFPSRQRQ